MERNENELKTSEPTPETPAAAPAAEVEVLEIEDDLDTGMHRVNVCKSF